MTFQDEMTDIEFLSKMAKVLKEFPRWGAAVDFPEGIRAVEISDTLALQWASRLSNIVKRLGEARAEVADPWLETFYRQHHPGGGGKCPDGGIT